MCDWLRKTDWRWLRKIQEQWESCVRSPWTFFYSFCINSNIKSKLVNILTHTAVWFFHDLINLRFMRIKNLEINDVHLLFTLQRVKNLFLWANEGFKISIKILKQSFKWTEVLFSIVVTVHWPCFNNTITEEFLMDNNIRPNKYSNKVYSFFVAFASLTQKECGNTVRPQAEVEIQCASEIGSVSTMYHYFQHLRRIQSWN